MLRTLRTKGLVARHWRMIGQKLEFVIDPANITLYRLIMLELYDEDGDDDADVNALMITSIS